MAALNAPPFFLPVTFTSHLGECQHLGITLSFRLIKPGTMEETNGNWKNCASATLTLKFSSVSEIEALSNHIAFSVLRCSVFYNISHLFIYLSTI